GLRPSNFRHPAYLSWRSLEVARAPGLAHSRPGRERAEAGKLLFTRGLGVPPRRLRRERCCAANRGRILLGADSTHLRGHLRHVVSAALAVLALVCLTGCGGGPSTSSFFSSASSLFSRSTKISLAPIVGAPQAVADQFTQALVDAGKDRRLTIVPGGSGDYTLRGYLLASSEKGGSKISYIFDVTDASGARVSRVSGDELIPGRAADPWEA